MLYSRCLHEMLPVRAKDAFMEILEYGQNLDKLDETLLTVPVVNVVSKTKLSRKKLQDILRLNPRKPKYTPNLGLLYDNAYKNQGQEHVSPDPVSKRYTLFDLILFHMVYSEYAGYCFAADQSYHKRMFFNDKSMYEVYKERLREYWSGCPESHLGSVLLSYFEGIVGIPRNENVLDLFFMVFIAYHLEFIAEKHPLIRDDHFKAIVWYNDLLTQYKRP